MKNKAAPSIVYEQRPLSPQTMYLGESSSSSSFYPYQYPPYPYPYDPYSVGVPSSSPPPQQRLPVSKPPPPPPSPPRSSPWDFLNFFDNSDDKYYSQTPYPATATATPSRDSREVREEEGIPDLEDEDYHHHEVVKQVHGTLS